MPTGLGYLSKRYTEWLSEAGIKHIFGSLRDPYETCWLKSVIGLYKTEVISRRKSWHDLRDIEFATLEWVNWFNNMRIFGAIGNIPPAEAFRKSITISRGPQRR